MSAGTRQPILQARGLVKRYGRVTALDHADFDLMPGEILGVIGDNGAGKSTLIKVLAGAVDPDQGEILPRRQAGPFPLADRGARGRHRDRLPEPRAVAGALDRRQPVPRPRAAQARARSARCSASSTAPSMQKEARASTSTRSACSPSRTSSQAVETLSGGQRQGVAVVRADRLRQPRRHHGRADRGARRQGIAEGARADARREEARPADRPDQPQHAARLRGRRPHPHPPPRPPHRRHRPERILDVGCGRDHDRRDEAAAAEQQAA